MTPNTANSGNTKGQLHLNHFPEGLKRRLKLKALETGVTLRDLVVAILEEGAEGVPERPVKPEVIEDWEPPEEVGDGFGESGSDLGAAGVRGVRAGVPLGQIGDDRGQKRVAEAGGAFDRAPADSRAVERSLRADPEDAGEEAEGDWLGDL